MFLHDVIKIEFVNLGYLPNYPYHLISDEEMLEAFIKEGGFFDDYYPCPGESFEESYTLLRLSIEDAVKNYLEEGTEIPNWVYSYMLRSVTSFQSDPLDIEYLYQLENMESGKQIAEFTEELAAACYETSKQWIKKLPSRYKDRPPTMFGEPHVIKSLRVDEANVLIESEGN